MDWQNVFETLEYRNQDVLNDEIDSISAVETDAFVSHWQGCPDDSPSKFLMKKFAPCLHVSVVNHVCSTPTLNSGTSGFNAAASNA
jgi:hypothetical protein